MVIERFSQDVLNTGLFRLYTATGFFATLIFFVLNSHLFSPVEIVFWLICSTILFKAIGNLMFGLIIALFNLDNKRDELDLKYNEDKIDAMLSELNIKDIEKMSKK